MSRDNWQKNCVGVHTTTKIIKLLFDDSDHSLVYAFRKLSTGLIYFLKDILLWRIENLKILILPDVLEVGLYSNNLLGHYTNALHENKNDLTSRKQHNSHVSEIKVNKSTWFLDYQSTRTTYEFNEHFVTIGLKLADKITGCTISIVIMSMP